jgi:hypothetical protein
VGYHSGIEAMKVEDIFGLSHGALKRYKGYDRKDGLK